MKGLFSYLKRVFKKEPLKCVWKLDEHCCGKVEHINIFWNQLRVPMCEYHLHIHECIMALHKDDADIEEVLNMPLGHIQFKRHSLGLPLRWR